MVRNNLDLFLTSEEEWRMIVMNENNIPLIFFRKRIDNLIGFILTVHMLRIVCYFEFDEI